MNKYVNSWNPAIGPQDNPAHFMRQHVFSYFSIRQSLTPGNNFIIILSNNRYFGIQLHVNNTGHRYLLVNKRRIHISINKRIIRGKIHIFYIHVCYIYGTDFSTK